MKRAIKKIREGIVVSDKMTKTIVVEVERKVAHPIYKKVVKINNKFKAHDENEIASEGDRVRIMEIRPMSKDKRWVVMEVIGKGKERIQEEDKGMPSHIRKAKLEKEALSKEIKVDTK